METLELQSFLHSYNSQNVKTIVCAIDRLPEKLRNDCEYGLIVNLSKITDTGSHWIAIWIDKARTKNGRDKSRIGVYVASI